MTGPLTVLDLFSGIGGFSLGLQRAGFQTVAFCEIEPYCRRVLAKHWPGVPCYDDVRTLDAARLDADGIGPVDVICGGFPCQDISAAGKGAGIEGQRSGLWREYARLVGEIRPRYVIVENVAALLGRGLGRVLGDIAEIGYDSCWNCIPASALGAPHRRDRVWIVACPACQLRHGSGAGAEQAGRHEPANRREALADADDAGCPQQRRPLSTLPELVAAERRRGWSPEPAVGRVASRVPHRVDRLRALGNSVVPQIPELIGKAIMADQFKAEALIA